MFYKVKTVIPMPNMELLVEFTDKQTKRYDVKPLLGRWKQFEALTATGLFNCVKVDIGGYGVSWNNDLDLSCNELWENGTSITDEKSDDLYCEQLYQEYLNDLDPTKHETVTFEEAARLAGVNPDIK